MKHKPIFRWAGGKAWLTYTLKNIYQVAGIERTYVEPFLGGGSAFFSLSPERSILNDINSDLIGVYKLLKGDPSRLFSEVSRFEVSESNYYKQRSTRYQDPWKAAARFIYLNRLCFGGLYRVNSNGDFNVPYGHKTSLGTSISLENFQVLSTLMKHSRIKCEDFSKVLAKAPSGSFIFCDPVYTSTNKERFDRYNSKVFNLEKHEELAGMLKRSTTGSESICVTSLPLDENIARLYGDGLWLCVASRKRSGFDRKASPCQRELLWLTGDEKYLDNIRMALKRNRDGAKLVGFRNGSIRNAIIQQWSKTEV